ncbi:MAG: phosphoribosylformylglycinamidine synthase [Caloramator sp.]|jgi:phosphoribosylamine--glycine ligase/phosphoribosylformylglycinamidine synthase|uniref:phosphoribosylamine--glycine ligase n=1 Tax=Caloramator sp. TaxID=1871330 RepID=UPI001E0792AF|nr:phosphoribosylamine--glycine ligase [Caloramator sp.]MBZ4664227.1 phosphoribosylformylglycinamidine synthase [Caloramator sp.]
MKILVLGSGGREHALSKKLAESSLCSKVYVCPGNVGTMLEQKCQNVDLEDIEDIIDFAKSEGVDLVVVGPEKYLILGAVDKFRENGIKIFGPSKKAALLEGSKAYSKEFMKRYGVKTASYEVFEEFEKAKEYLNKVKYPVVIKADGLAQGKGVVICSSKDEAEDTLFSFMVEDLFKGSGKRVVIEKYLEGVEASIICITDGKTIKPFVSAKDHKRLMDNDRGPNTGGMGVVAPNRYVTDDVFEKFKEDIMERTLLGIREENLDYKGFIYFGIMITKEGPYLLEYNVRFGDPEAQAILPLLKSDLVELILKTLNGRLDECEFKWIDGASCNVVLASRGYPVSPILGDEIFGLESIKDVDVFISGVKLDDGRFYTNGGRVLSLTAVGETLELAREKVYKEIEKIKFEGMHYRKDI